MTLVTRIALGSKVYLATDEQINTRNNIKIDGVYACKSCIVPGKNIAIGISGKLQWGKDDILDIICLDIILSCVNTRKECCNSLSKTFRRIKSTLPKEWYNTIHVSMLENGKLQSFTYFVNYNFEGVSDVVIPTQQLHPNFLKSCIDLWTSFEYYNLLKDNEWRRTLSRKQWTVEVDFNFNYAHLLEEIDIDDQEVWYLYAKCYTLLYFEFIERKWDYSRIEDLSDSEIVDLLKSFHKKIGMAAQHFKHDLDKDIPFKAIGDVNQIIVLRDSGNKAEYLWSSRPCKSPLHRITSILKCILSRIKDSLKLEFAT